MSPKDAVPVHFRSVWRQAPERRGALGYAHLFDGAIFGAAMIIPDYSQRDRLLALLRAG